MVPRVEEGAGVAAPTPKVDPFCGSDGFAKVSESDSNIVFADKKCGLPRAGRQADDNALVGTQTNVSYILSQDADAHGCASHFLHDLDAPCYDLAARRAHALAALYVETLLQEAGRAYPIDHEMLVTILRSFLHMRCLTAERIIDALADAGLLVAVRPVEVIPWP